MLTMNISPQIFVRTNDISHLLQLVQGRHLTSDRLACRGLSEQKQPADDATQMTNDGVYRETLIKMLTPLFGHCSLGGSSLQEVVEAIVIEDNF